MKVIVSFACFAFVVADLNFAQKEHMLPPLFRLDDYHRCLSNKDGLYCLGVFDLTPRKQPHPTYELMKEFSRELTNFNRTRIYRGYCVSARYPSAELERNASLRFERNASLRVDRELTASQRFERCAAKWAHRRMFNATLQEFQYCRRREQIETFTVDRPYIVFTSIFGIILFLNIIGTVYDVNTEDEKQKKSLLVSWSIRCNWRRFTKNGSTSQLSTGAGLKVVIMVVMILVHNGLLLHTTYLQNPIFLEQMARYPLTMIVHNGSSSTQLYIVISTFLGSYYLLKSASNGIISFSSLWRHIWRRLIRLAPVHLFVVGFAATWWRWLADGPLWSSLVGAESERCRTKFWWHVFFASNLVESEISCILPTWSICVDFQLYSMGAAISMVLARARHAIPILVVMFVASCTVNTALAYMNDWRAMIYVVRAPEHVRTVFRHSPSHYSFYTTPWGALPSCLLGLIAAHHYAAVTPSKTKSNEKKTETRKSIQYQRLKLVGAVFGVLSVFGWLLAGNLFKRCSSRLFLAVYAALERVLFLALAGLSVWAGHRLACLKSILSWRCWTAGSRLSLSVMMVHWVLTMTVVGRRTHLVEASLFTMIMDGISITFASYLLALPLTLLVEMPVQSFMDTLIL